MTKHVQHVAGASEGDSLCRTESANLSTLYLWSKLLLVGLATLHGHCCRIQLLASCSRKLLLVKLGEEANMFVLPARRVLLVVVGPA